MGHYNSTLHIGSYAFFVGVKLGLQMQQCYVLFWHSKALIDLLASVFLHLMYLAIFYLQSNQPSKLSIVEVQNNLLTPAGAMGVLTVLHCIK